MRYSPRSALDQAFFKSVSHKRPQEAERLRHKRLDSDYLAAERIRNAKRMRVDRRKRRKAGICRYCDAKAAPGRVCCNKHLLATNDRVRARRAEKARKEQ